MKRTMEEWLVRTEDGRVGTWPVSDHGNQMPQLIEDMVAELVALRKRVAQLEGVNYPGEIAGH